MRTITTSIVLACTTLALHGQSPRAATFDPSRPVQFFEVKHRNLIDALLSFGQQEHVPIAIEYIDKPAFRQLITFEFRNRLTSDILDVITQAVGYQWHSSGHVVTVTHRGALVGKSNLLNTRIPQFRIGETSMHVQILGRGRELGTDDLRKLIERVDRKKQAMARERLAGQDGDQPDRSPKKMSARLTEFKTAR